MAAVEQTYAYLAPSTVAVDSDGTEVTLSTSGGRSPHPYFFTGFLGQLRQTAQALLVVAEVARTRYYVPPGSASRLAAADPVEAVLEHAASRRLALTTQAGRTAFQRVAAEVSASSKLGRLTRRLLELEADPAQEEAVRVAAAEAVVARTQGAQIAPR